MLKVRLVGIDWQNDFVDDIQGVFGRNMPEAAKAAERFAKMIKRILPKIWDIDETVDSHPYRHIAHPIWWVDSNGNHPKPFTLISVDDVWKGSWRTTNPAFQQRALDYVETLERNGRYVLCIWPPHCLIGSWGHNIYPAVYDAFRLWEEKYGNVNYHVKGSNPFTEHYSAVMADVPDPTDPTTMLDTKPGSLIHSLGEADIIPITGIASSHCLANTALDIANNFPDPAYISKMVLIEDATAAVPGFEYLYEKFVNEMVPRGMQISTTDKFLA